MIDIVEQVANSPVTNDGLDCEYRRRYDGTGLRCYRSERKAKDAYDAQVALSKVNLAPKVLSTVVYSWSAGYVYQTEHCNTLAAALARSVQSWWKEESCIPMFEDFIRALSWNTEYDFLFDFHAYNFAVVDEERLQLIDMGCVTGEGYNSKPSDFYRVDLKASKVNGYPVLCGCSTIWPREND